MDVHEFRLQLFLCSRSRNPHTKPGRIAGILAQSSRGTRCGIRISQLARPFGPKIPSAEIVVRHTALRSGGIAVFRASQRENRANVFLMGAERFSLRVDGAGSTEFNLFPSEGIR